MCPKPVILLVFLALLCGCSGPPEAERWSEDYPAAAARAEKEHLVLLMLFTGRDWCPACQHLEKTVLNHPDFLRATEGRAVRFLADFPHGSVQDPALAQQNMALVRRFRIKVFPTMLLLRNGREVARQEGAFSGPSQFLAFFACAKP